MVTVEAAIEVVKFSGSFWAGLFLRGGLEDVVDVNDVVPDAAVTLVDEGGNDEG